MSSLVVRNAFKNFLASDVPTETVVDLSGEYEEIQDTVLKYGLTPDDDWLGIQYIGGDELPIDVTANNSQGKYREFGLVYLHIVGVVSDTVRDDILTRAENIRSKLRGQRIGNVVVEKVGPPNFNAGSTLQFTGGYVAAVVVVDYKYDLNL